MKKIKYLLIIVLSIAYINVKAVDSCTTEELNRLNELAKNVEVKYDYEIVTETTDDFDLNDNIVSKTYKIAKYNLNILNLDSDLKISYQNSDYEFVNISKDELEKNEYFDGNSIVLKISSYTSNLCTDRVLKTINVEFPYYNIFYDNHKDECKKYSDFKYCQELIDEDISENLDEIEEKFKKYQKDPTIDVDIDVEPTKSNNIIVYLSVFFVIVLIIIVLIFTIRNIILKRKKDSDLK